MRLHSAAVAVVALMAWGSAPKPDEFRQLTTVNALPMALDPAFEFRKTKLFALGPGAAAGGPSRGGGQFAGGVSHDPAVGFEAGYLLHGAVTQLDQRRRWGNYLDFFWRAKRRADLTVRLEYRQERLRDFTQAREVTYRNVKGNKKTSFAIIGDDFFNDGRVLAWRCLLIENGRIVAEERSYLWR
jgi:hypothetical protein